jgi:hypothetical protein
MQAGRAPRRLRHAGPGRAGEPLDRWADGTCPGAPPTTHHLHWQMRCNGPNRPNKPRGVDNTVTLDERAELLTPPAGSNSRQMALGEGDR